VAALEKLIDPITRGDPESPLRWTCKSTHALAAELLARHGIQLSYKTVSKLLRDHDYSLQAPNKSVEGAQHPDRNAQFEYINAKAQACVERGVPVISVDTKKKELVGNFKNGGREWHPKGEPDLVDVHDFPSDALGKAIPYGVYDLAANDGFVSVGVDHDTPVFAVTSIEAWWSRVGAKRYPEAREIFSSSPPTRVEATATGRTCGSTNCNASPTSSTCRSTSATFRPAPASGTRSSTACSRSSPSIGAAALCEPTRPSSTSSAIRPTGSASSCAPAWIVAAIRSARRFRRRNCET
jgi:hypothetical protein